MEINKTIEMYKCPFNKDERELYCIAHRCRFCDIWILYYREFFAEVTTA